MFLGKCSALQIAKYWTYELAIWSHWLNEQDWTRFELVWMRPLRQKVDNADEAHPEN